MFVESDVSPNRGQKTAEVGLTVSFESVLSLAGWRPIDLEQAVSLESPLCTAGVNLKQHLIFKVLIKSQ